MIDKFIRIMDDLEPRRERLEASGLYIEAFLLHSITIEFILRSAISYQQELISHLIKKSNLNLKSTPVTQLEKLSLGELIRIFSMYCNDDDLISRLNNFNSLRIKVIHGLIAQPIKSLNKEAAGKRSSHSELIVKLCRYNVILIDKKRRILKRKRLYLTKTSSIKNKIVSHKK